MLGKLAARPPFDVAFANFLAQGSGWKWCPAKGNPPPDYVQPFFTTLRVNTRHVGMPYTRHHAEPEPTVTVVDVVTLYRVRFFGDGAMDAALAMTLWPFSPAAQVVDTSPFTFSVLESMEVNEATRLVNYQFEDRGLVNMRVRHVLGLREEWAPSIREVPIGIQDVAAITVTVED